MGKPRPGAAAPAAPGRTPGIRDLLATAMTHGAAGRFEQAETALESVLEQRPNEPDALHGMARIALQHGELDRALSFARRAVTAAPRRAHYHATLARILQDTDRPEDALASARRAIALDENNIAAHCVEAGCHLKMNRVDEAMTAAERALERAPSDLNAQLVAARIETRNGDPAAALERLEKVLERGDLDALAGVGFLHQAGMAHDKLGDWDAAFDAFSRCGAVLRETPAAKRVDADRSLRTAEGYRRGTTPELLSRWDAADLADGLPSPVFLVGFPRSGTTLTEQILAAHPLAKPSDEHEFLMTTIAEMGAMHPGSDPCDIPALIRKLDLAQARELRASYRARVASTLGPVPDGGIVIDKLPLNLVKMPFINAIFPDARVIVALRDPRDVCLSCFMQSFKLNEGTIHFLDITDTATYYAAVMTLWLHVRPMLTLAYEESRYETLVGDLEPCARRLIEFVSLDWTPEILRFHEKAKQRVIRTPSAAAVTERVHTRAVGRWRNYEQHLQPAMPILQPLVRALGYD